MDNLWKQNWELTKQRFSNWWNAKGFCLWITAPKEQPWTQLDAPAKFDTPEQRWMDPVARAKNAEYTLSRTFFGGEAFPYFDTNIGPGNLATFIGSKPRPEWRTVWYEPCIFEPEKHPPLVFRTDSPNFQTQLSIIKEGIKTSQGHFLVSMPDLIENIDTLASLRGNENLMIDLLDRPGFVKQRLAEINQAYFQAFDALYHEVRTPHGGNAFSAFSIWGPGKTAKLQCDASAMFSAKMFREFVVPPMAEQCDWLDFSLFHLDGVNCIRHLDLLLEIDNLNAIQWTPGAGHPSTGDPTWYDLYSRILNAGKSAQALGVDYHKVIPLLESVGAEGMFVLTHAPTETLARELLDKVKPFRSV